MLAATDNAAIKLAPGSVPPEAWQTRAECEWIAAPGNAGNSVLLVRRTHDGHRPASGHVARSRRYVAQYYRRRPTISRTPTPTNKWLRIS